MVDAFMAGMWGVVGVFAGFVALFAGFLVAGSLTDRIRKAWRKSGYARHIKSLEKKP